MSTIYVDDRSITNIKSVAKAKGVFQTEFCMYSIVLLTVGMSGLFCSCCRIRELSIEAEFNDLTQVRRWPEIRNNSLDLVRKNETRGSTKSTPSSSNFDYTKTLFYVKRVRCCLLYTTID
jgi:hypothetical protein